jgi:hypothetical protein
MTSVQNHLPLLNGSKVRFFLFLFSLYFVACTPTKRVSRDDVQVVKGGDKPVEEAPKPVEPTKPVEEPKPKVDPIKPKIAEYRRKYNIVLVLPFSQKESDQRFLQYYGGVKVAAKELEQEGIDMTVKVVNANDVSFLNQIKTDSTHLIIAPNEEAKLKSTIDFATKNKISVVSPFYSLSSIENNPFYIQLKPSLRSHYYSMINDIAKGYKASETVIVGKNIKADVTAMKHCQVAAAELYYTNASEVIQQYFVSEDSAANTTVELFKELIRSGKKAFIFPTYSYKDEVYLYNLLRKLNKEKSGNRVVAYGMPLIKDSDKFTSDILAGLSMHVPVSKNIDAADEVIKNNVDRIFYEITGALPDEDTYEGRDNMLFIGRSLYKHGIYFQELIKEVDGDYLLSTYDIKPLPNQEQPSIINYYENKYLNMLQFVGGRFIAKK